MSEEDPYTRMRQKILLGLTKLTNSTILYSDSLKGCLIPELKDEKFVFDWLGISLQAIREEMKRQLGVNNLFKEEES